MLTSFISPYRADRDIVRALHAASGMPFIEVHVDCELAEAEKRDPKGHYKKARAGQIKNFTGIDSDYEPPEKAEIVLKTAEHPVEDLADQVIAYLRDKGRV